MRKIDLRLFDELVDDGEEVVGQEGFKAEVYVQTCVLVLGFGKAADDEHGEVGREGAELSDELGAGHAGHQVVGEDEVDGGVVLVVAELV